MTDTRGLVERLRRVEAKVAETLVAAGRPADAVRLIAVSKMQPVEAVVAAYDAGVRDFGENVAQDLALKATALADTGRTPRWHFIGRLQRNKVRVVAAHAHTVHSVDRPELVVSLGQCVAGAAPLPVLVQVNIGREPQKGGVDPDATLDLAQQVGQHHGLRLVGLMAVPPADDSPEPHFRRLAELSRHLRDQSFGRQATELSMGMSHDFVAAIHCGATLVRVGSAIFGERPRREDQP